MKTDLHFHSYYSDSTASIEKLAEELISKKVMLASLTDHDSVEGSKLLKEKLKDTDIKLIQGIEITASVMYEDSFKEVHILGYNFDPENQELIDLLEYNKIKRHAELKEKTNNAFNEGLIQCDFKTVEEEHNYTSNIFVYQIMVSCGHKEFTTQSINDFKRNILKLKDIQYASISDTINAIKNAGGIAVLAHPKRTIAKTHQTLEYFLDFPFDGIEVYYQNHNKEDETKYLEYAKLNKLMVTGGSDYHKDFAGYPALLGDCSINEQETIELLKRLSDTL